MKFKSLMTGLVALGLMTFLAADLQAQRPGVAKVAKAVGSEVAKEEELEVVFKVEGEASAAECVGGPAT